MTQEATQDGAIRFKCVCEEELRIEPDLLGRVFACPKCGRPLRVSLHFMLVEQKQAPNLAAVCTCGRFIVDEADKAGKKVKCKVCGQQMVLPKPIERKDAAPIIHVPASVLQKQLRRVRGKRPQEKIEGGEISRMQKAGHRGRISLRPGQQVCINPKCSIPLPAGANVCARCGVNMKTGVRYQGNGPEDDPLGKWKRV